MARAGSIEVDIRANSAQFVREMRNLRRSVSSMEKQMAAFGRAVRSGFALFGVAGGASLVNNVLETANALDDMAKRLGVSAEQLQTWQIAAERAGINTSTFNNAIQRVIRNAANAAKGIGEAQGAFRELGIDAARFVELNLSQKIFELDRAFERAGSSANQLALAQKLADSEGTALLQLLELQTRELRALRNEADKLSLTDEQIRRLAEANTELVKAGQGIQFIAGLGVGAITSGVERIVNAWRFVTGDLENIERTAGSYEAAVAASMRAAETGSTPVPGGGAAGELERLRQEAVTFEQLMARFRATSLPAFAQQSPGVDLSRFGIETDIMRIIDKERELSQAGNEVRLAFEKDATAMILKEREQLADQTRQLFQDTFEDSLLTFAERGFDGVFQLWLQLLQRMAAQQLGAQLFGGAGGGGFLSAIFGGAGDAAVVQNNVRGVP